METTTQTMAHIPERRRNKVYVTQNTEYHTRDGLCVRVRDRQGQRWFEEHLVLGHSLAGSMRRPADDGMEDWAFHQVPEPGDRLLFRAGAHQVVTSQLIEVARPSREVAAAYPSWTTMPAGAGSTSHS